MDLPKPVLLKTYLGGASREPAPLVAPAIGLALGIAAGEHGVISDGAAVAWLVAAGGLAAVIVVLNSLLRRLDVSDRRGRGSSAGLILIPTCALLAAGCIGVARHRVATELPSSHVGALLTDETIIARLAGHIVTRPVVTAGRRENPFLPFAPQPRTRLVVAVRESLAQARPTPIHGLVRVTLSGERTDLSPGDAVTLTGRLYRPRGPRNPGEPDWAALGRLKGIHAGLFVPGADLVRVNEAAAPSAWRRVLDRWRALARGVLLDALAGFDSRPDGVDSPGAAPMQVLDAMLLGQRSSVERDLNEAFLRTGAIHFLTVSGFHVGFLGGMTWLALRHFGRRPAAIGTLIVLVAYALLAEPNAPILRATLMGAALCASQLLDRPAGALNALGLAWIALLLASPLELFRGGFQLSFLQVAVLVVLLPPIWRRLTRRELDGEPLDADSWTALAVRRAGGMLLGLALVSVISWTVSAPLVAQHFGVVAPWSPLHSIIISPLVMLVLIAGFAHLALGTVLAWPTGWLLSAATQLLLSVVHFLAAFPGTLLRVTPPGVAATALTIAAVLLILWKLGRAAPASLHDDSSAGVKSGIPRPGWGWAAAGLLALGWGPEAARRMVGPSDSVTLLALDVGNGSGQLLMTRSATYVFDLGTLYNRDAGEIALDALRTLRAPRPAGVFLSHTDLDHYSGIPTLLAAAADVELWSHPLAADRSDPRGSVRLLLESLGDSIEWGELTRGDRLESNDLVIDVLHPPRDVTDWRPNDRSLVLRVSAHGRRLLFTGDIESQAMRGLLDAGERGEIDLRADVLMAPHHGAVVGETRALLEAVGRR